MDDGYKSIASLFRGVGLLIAIAGLFVLATGMYMVTLPMIGIESTREMAMGLAGITTFVAMIQAVALQIIMES